MPKRKIKLKFITVILFYKCEEIVFSFSRYMQLVKCYISFVLSAQLMTSNVKTVGARSLAANSIHLQPVSFTFELIPYSLFAIL